MKPILLSAAGNAENQDRGIVICESSRLVLCVADGAGGLSGGKEAATVAIDIVRRDSAEVKDADECAELLRRMDVAIDKDKIAGETTCAFAIVTSDEVFGASTGDSGIWRIPPDGIHSDLTGGQQRKPFLGSGSARPVSFRCSGHGGMLLLATDGLFKYTSAERIIEVCRKNPLDVAAPELIELVRYPSGALPDDVTLILASY